MGEELWVKSCRFMLIISIIMVLFLLPYFSRLPQERTITYQIKNQIFLLQHALFMKKIQMIRRRAGDMIEYGYFHSICCLVLERVRRIALLKKRDFLGRFIQVGPCSYLIMVL